MVIDKELAQKMWKDIFGNVLWAQDCFGTWMHFDDYGDRNKTRNNRPNGTGKDFSYGWEIDHIRPKNNFSDEKESDFLNNFEPMHYCNNVQKGDDLSFFINNVEYEICNCEICEKNNKKGYGIRIKNNKKRIDWKARTNSFYL